LLDVESSVTVKDVARIADVSVGTVSRVFNNHSNVTDEIRQRVLKAAAELGYARLVSAEVGHTSYRTIKEVGYLYCSSVDVSAFTSNPFWSYILSGVEAEARKTSIKITYRAIGELVQSPQLLLSTVQEMKLGGILLVGPTEPETVQLLKGLQTPLVLVDNYVRGLSVDSVLSDNFEGARIAVDYLIEQGHQHIAFIGGPVWRKSKTRLINQIYTFERRSSGYRTALLDAGLPINYELFESCDLSTEGGYEACKRLIEHGNQFTAVFCGNDNIAIGVVKALHEAGLRVPDDVSVVGFDDIDVVKHLTPALTTVRVNKEAIGAVAIRSLLTRFADPESTSVTSIIDVELIVRASVAPPRR
jgi:DNA-binding LacI/PurR family transcriptional regulator